MQEQNKLRAEFFPKMIDLAADKLRAGGAKELKDLREKYKKSFDELEEATSKKYPLAIEDKLKKISRALRDVTDLFDATGDKPITDAQTIKAFVSALSAESGLSEDELKVPNGVLTRDLARGLAVTAKIKLYKLDEWNGFEFRAAAVSGWLGDKGDDVEFSKDMPEAAKKVLQEDVNLKQKRDIAITEFFGRYGSKREAYLAMQEQMEEYKKVKDVFRGHHVYASSHTELVRFERQIKAFVTQNEKDWVSGNDFPEMKKLHQDFVARQQQLLKECRERVQKIKQQMREN